MAKQIQLSDVKAYALARLPKQVALSNVQGYALTTPTKPLGLRQLPVYVMGSFATTLGLRALPVYVMGPSLPTLVKGITGNEAVLRLVVKNAKTIRPTSDFSLDAPKVLTGDPLFNSTVRSTPNAASGLAGAKVFRYNRLDITRLVDNPNNFDIGNATTVLGLLSAINAYSGLVLTTDDLVDGPVNVTDQFVTLTAKSTSWFFIPGTTLQLGRPLPSIDAVITTDTLNW